jgi:transcriptional regulator with XRE-family HTH domain
MLEMALVNFFPEGTARLIPHYQRRDLREELAKELSLLRREMGFSTMHELARTAKVSLGTVSALEHARWTKEYVTVLTLHKIAEALSRTLIFKVRGMEKYFSAEIPVEELHALGVRIIFSCEG